LYIVILYFGLIVQNILEFTVIDSADRFGQAIFGEVHDDCPLAKAKNVIWHCSMYVHQIYLHASI